MGRLGGRRSAFQFSGSGTGAGALVGGLALLNGEQGLGIDFTTLDGLGSIAVYDATTPANNRSNVPADSFLTQSGTSPKWVLSSSGLWTQVAVGHVAIEYDGVSSYYLLVEPAATNLCLQSNDFTNASWTKSNMTTALTATGPDGVANSASTLTASAGNATALQAITSASASRVTSMYVKRRTGSGNIDLTQDNGGTWTTQTVTNSWTRVALAAVTSANPTVGIRIVTNADAVDVAWFQHETGNGASSPIPTTTVTVTRASDDIQVVTTAFPLNETTMSLLISAVPLDVTTAGDMVGLAKATFAEWFGFYQNASLINYAVRHASAYTFNGAAGSDSNGVALKAGIAAQANDMVVTLNAAAPTTTGAAAMPNGETKLYIGKGVSLSNTAPSQFRLKTLVYLPRRLSNAELQTRTT